MGTGFSKRKKQAKMMQQQLDKLKETLSHATATGSAGNGLVTVTLNGSHEMESIKIKPDCVDPEDVEGLEDLIKVAYNQAQEKIQEQTPQGIPGMPDLGSLGLG